MSGTIAGLTPREARKRRLVRESEINRGRLEEDVRALAKGAAGLVQRACQAGRFAAMAALFAAGWRAWRRSRPRRPDGRTSRLATWLGIVRIGTVFWAAFRPRRR